MAKLNRNASPRSAPVAALIGDVVGSRATRNRSALHRDLVKALEEANQHLAPAVPLRVTVGDEFQGCFTTVGQALHAALWLRARLAPSGDLRHGVGWGEVGVLDDEPRVEDGPAWWAAREAIDHVRSENARPATRGLRTAYRLADGTSGPDPLAVNAALICRDHLVGSPSATKGAGMTGDGRTMRLLLGLMDGRSQSELAEEEGISPSAVSQRVRADGIGAVLAADALLRELA